jgi:hypothetical protein
VAAVHPIERLRYVARAGGAPPSSLVREAAGALAGFADDPAGLVTACRRLVDRHPQVGPMWWLAARILSASDPVVEAWRVADELDEDPTGGVLAAALPESVAVVVLGWPELVGSALRRRGDLQVLVVDALGEGAALARRLRSSSEDVVEVAESGLGAAVAQSAGVRAWLVAGVGRILPAPLWEGLGRRLDEDPEEPWERPYEVMPLDLVSQVVGPGGLEGVEAALARADCPVAPELLKPSGG